MTMNTLMRVLALALAAVACPLHAADYPAPKEDDWVVRDFKFHTGEALPELKLHYTTIGDPKGEPVVVLHGTTGSAASMLTPAIASRNWMMRRLIVDSIRNDPEWMEGNYTKQPKSAQFASVFYAIATNGGNFGHFKAAPTREKADQVLDQRLAAKFTADANDV